MCHALEVSASGYYNWLNQKPCKRKTDDIKYKKLLKEIYVNSHKTYGCVRLGSVLSDMGIHIGRHRILRLQREEKLFPVQRKKFYHTTDSNHKFPVCKNLVKQKFFAPAANLLWTSDVKMIRTYEGWLYLCVILDVFSRLIVGWALESYKGAALVHRAIDNALRRRTNLLGCIFHSDKGSEYAAITVQKRLQLLGFRQSMSGKGNCYDNAVTESFFATVEKELLPQIELKEKKDTRTKIFCYIETWYNTKRKHSYVGNISPTQFEQRLTGAY